MYLTVGVLNNIHNDLLFYSIDVSINISDCERINIKPKKKLPPDKLFWFDYKTVKEKDVENQSAILLIEKSQFDKLDKNLLPKCKIIATSDPKLIFTTICSYFYNDEVIREIHPTAHVHPKAKIGLNVSIGYNAFIDECKIGDNCIIHENCTVAKGVQIGTNTEIHSGAKVGLQVFGFEKNPSGAWIKYPQIGSIRIGNNVTIGANTCISNGFIGDTNIDDYTVIDNLCQIGSSAVIGKYTNIAANSSISNNTKIGQRCWIAPGVSIKENLVITDDVFIGIGSVVIRSITKPCTVFGFPAMQIPTG
ncbi:MAG: hypothetical protein NT004_11010 [Bacteroidetes bacterium]|nr:hypothetical protein [Bacteroidota bacterium]